MLKLRYILTDKNLKKLRIFNNIIGMQSKQVNF